MLRYGAVAESRRQANDQSTLLTCGLRQAQQGFPEPSTGNSSVSDSFTIRASPNPNGRTLKWRFWRRFGCSIPSSWCTNDVGLSRWKLTTVRPILLTPKRAPPYVLMLIRNDAIYTQSTRA